MRTITKLWENLYAKLGQVDPECPQENKIIKQTMKPWRYEKQAEMIAEMLNVQDSVLEVGCGYGGLASEILKLVPVKYSVVENELMLNHSWEYLGDKVEYIEAEKIETLQDRKFTLFISNYCLSETPPEYQQYVLENIIKNCQKIFIIDYDDTTIPIVERIILSKEKYLKKYFIIDKIQTAQGRYFLYFGERKK